MKRFRFVETFIKGLLLIEPNIFYDERGFFTETWRQCDFKSVGIEYDFVQDNQSKSSKGVLRGLHFQMQHDQAKLVRVVCGEVFDVVVDLRKQSDTYLQWIGLNLSDENKRTVFIPEGMAHGYLALRDNTHMIYKLSNYYQPELEAGIRYDDPTINIRWPILDIPFILSKRDDELPYLFQNTLKGCC